MVTEKDTFPDEKSTFRDEEISFEGLYFQDRPAYIGPIHDKNKRKWWIQIMN